MGHHEIYSRAVAYFFAKELIQRYGRHHLFYHIRLQRQRRRTIAESQMALSSPHHLPIAPAVPQTSATTHRPPPTLASIQSTVRLHTEVCLAHLPIMSLATSSDARSSKCISKAEYVSSPPCDTFTLRCLAELRLSTLQPTIYCCFPPCAHSTVFVFHDFLLNSR
jgi:hypothetical protein